MEIACLSPEAPSNESYLNLIVVSAIFKLFRAAHKENFLFARLSANSWYNFNHGEMHKKVPSYLVEMVRMDRKLLRNRDSILSI